MLIVGLARVRGLRRTFAAAFDRLALAEVRARYVYLAYGSSHMLSVSNEMPRIGAKHPPMRPTIALSP
jgi:hypothetical protein